MFSARLAVTLAAGLMAALLGGCASPGPPLPPSLKLPEIATGLTATRVGDAVMLHWTTPSRTTDKLLITGPIMAEICRDTPQPAIARKPGPDAARTAVAKCSAVVRVKVTPGVSDAVDTLPEPLASGPVRLLAYRVELLNTAGRTAGPSPAVFAASGEAPPAVQDVQVKATKAGVVVEWKAEAQGSGDREQGTGGADFVELDRTAIASPVAAPVASPVAANSAVAAGSDSGSGSAKKSGLSGSAKEPAEVRLRAGAAGDAGGTTDRTAQIGHTYRYSAQRVRTVVAGDQAVGDQTLEVRSVPSAAVTVAMLDVFPPDIPAGLVAVPGFAEEQKPAIDLSWDPNMEPRIAGYRVYRRDVSPQGQAGASDSWQRLGTELVRVPAYRDPTVTAGRRYAYRVTAVNEVGNESAPSGEVAETAPAE